MRKTTKKIEIWHQILLEHLMPHWSESLIFMELVNYFFL